MKGTDWAVLAGVGIVGYGLLNSGFFKGLGDVGEGVGDAVGGVGAGVGYAGQAAGYNLADIFNAFGQLGQSSQVLIREGGLQSREIIRETGEGVTGILDAAGTDLIETTDKTGNILSDVANIGSDASGSLRSVNKGFWDSFNDTWNLNEPTNIFTNTAKGVKNVGSSVFNWVKTQVSDDKSVRTSPSITGAVVANSSRSSGSSSNSGSKSIRTTPTTSANTASFMEKLGYQGVSTIDGVKWEKTPVKLPWN